MLAFRPSKFSHGAMLCARLFGPAAVRRLCTAEADLLQRVSDALFAGRPVQFTDRLRFEDDRDRPAMPIFRVLNSSGRLVSPGSAGVVDAATALKIYDKMLLSRTMDRILYECQRQGRISFYMTSYGEEGTTLGSAAALHDEDLIFAQYREPGPLLWRGYELQSLVDQCVGNADDKGQGRQMPVHYGSREFNYVTVSSPLATQIPQAVGAAYGFKLKRQSRVVICYFGDGAASEGDCDTAFNFAATLHCPVIFFCRNNGYAISTAARQQYAGDGIAARGPAYGLSTIRVDGNDPFAVYAAVKQARQLAVDGKPSLIEAVTYRIGHHSTSDDSTAYRPKSEIEFWQNATCPMARLRSYLLANNLLTEEEEVFFKKKYDEDVILALKKAELKPKPPIESLFTDVYDELTPRLQSQMQELKDVD